MDWIILELQQREMVQDFQGKEKRNTNICHYLAKKKKISSLTHWDKLMKCTLFIYPSILFFSFLKKMYL